MRRVQAMDQRGKNQASTSCHLSTFAIFSKAQLTGCLR
ncbi:hypothetical protein C2W63_03841 [Bacillus velezensis]|nr:hypothetical protein C2W63_03841 [Bacillus velezensis]